MAKREDKSERALNLSIPAEWHEALRSKAFHDRRSIADLVRDALRDQYGFTDPREARDSGTKGGERAFVTSGGAMLTADGPGTTYDAKGKRRE